MFSKLIIFVSVAFSLTGAVLEWEKQINEKTFYIRGEPIYLQNCNTDELSNAYRNQFMCNDNGGKCVHKYLDKCDTVINCPNGADEQSGECRKIWQDGCKEEPKQGELYKCVNGMCISSCQVCDGVYVDCSDASDENSNMCNDEALIPDKSKC